jgi:hypothetical protein
MENLLSNQEFNDLLKEVKIEKHDFQRGIIDDIPKSVDDLLGKLKIYWKIIKPILKIAKIITPQKIDKGINEFISIVNRLCQDSSEEEQSDLLDKFAIHWGIISPILISVKALTPQKADLIINEVLQIGDLLAKS